MTKKILLVFLCLVFFIQLNAQECFYEGSSKKSLETCTLVTDANSFAETAQFPQAVEKLNLALAIGIKADDSLVEAAAHYQIAKTLFFLKNYKEALKSINKSIALQKQFPKSTCLTISYFLKADIFLEQNDFSKADNIFKKIATFNYSSPKTEALQNFYSGKRLEMTGKPQLAIRPLLLALDYFDKNKLSFKKATCLYYMAKTAEKLNDSKSALNFAIQAKRINETNHYALSELKILDFLSELYYSRQNYEVSNHYNKKGSILRDSIFYSGNRLVVSNLENIGRIDQAAETITELYKKNSEQKKTLNFNQIAIILSVLSICILSLFILAIFKNNNLRGNANKILYEKNAQLLKEKEKAEAASKAKEQFLSTITHELRTPIYAITGLTYLLLKGNPSKDQKENLDSLRISSEHLLALINNVLDLNKLDAKKVKIVETKFDLSKEMREFISTFQNSAGKKNVKLVLEIDDNIPNYLKGDILKIKQALMNLVSNAIRFSENGNVWVRLKLHEEKQKNVEIIFEIEDSGVGIPKDKQKKIFQKFDQGSKNTNQDYGGTGLGLSIVKNLLIFFGSKIHLESELGKGSKFYFTLKFKKLEPSEIAIRPGIKIDFNQKNQDDFLSDKKILIVEDNKLNQKITQRILAKKEIQSDIAENGEIAVQMAQAKKYDLILMDIHMPVMDGVEATKAIREKDKEIPIIALTAVEVNEDTHNFKEGLFTSVVQKPYKTEVFFNTLYYFLKEAES